MCHTQKQSSRSVKPQPWLIIGQNPTGARSRFTNACARAQVRKAFRAEADNALVVADYGQLELRLLAHMAGCASMLDAFRLGGDFHSRTALGMYDHIQDAVRRGGAPEPK